MVHGSQPDALVLCHQAGRKSIEDYPDYPIPPLPECIRRYEEAAALTNRNAHCIGVSINTSGFGEKERIALLASAERETGLPCADPIVSGVAGLLRGLS